MKIAASRNDLDRWTARKPRRHVDSIHEKKKSWNAVSSLMYSYTYHNMRIIVVYHTAFWL